MIDFAAQRLFGRHIVDCPHNRAGLRVETESLPAVGNALALGQLCQTKVQHLNVAVATYHYVLRLYVPMNDSFGERRRKRSGDLDRNVQSPFQIQLAGVHALAQCLAFYVLSRNKVRSSVLSDIVNGKNIWMVERGGGPRLSSESQQLFTVARESRRQKLQSDLAAQSCVLSQVDLSHPALPQERKYDLLVYRRGGFRCTKRPCCLILGWAFNELSSSVVSLEQPLDLLTQRLVSGADLRQKRGTIPSFALERAVEQSLDELPPFVIHCRGCL